MSYAIKQNNKSTFFRLFFPLDRRETLLFSGLLVFYLCISLYFAFFSILIDHPTKETDLYFSLDNPLIFKYGRSHISGHPLTIIFYYPFVVLGNFLAFLLGAKAKTVLFAALSSVMISLSCLYIHRYIKNIVELANREALLLTIFFALFSTNLILCFTPETFTLAAFFLSFSAYFYAYHIKNRIFVSPIYTSILASVCLGGVTVTNFVKGIIPIFFLKESFRAIFKKLLVTIIVFFIILLLTQVLLYYADGRSFFHLMVGHQQEFTAGFNDSFVSYLKHVFFNFWGAPMFFPELINLSYYSPANSDTINMLYITDYRYWWQYLSIVTLSIALLWAIIKNYKNPLMQILVLLLAVDLGIHCVLEFGINTPFIYGGHWVYIVPLILAWLFKDIKKKSTRNISYTLLCLLVIGIAVNNGVRLIEFAKLANEVYPI